MGVPVHSVSAVTGEGLDALDPYLAPGRTIVLLGSSGVGKSTLVNRFAGREVLATRPRRATAAAGGTRRRIASSCRCRRGAILLDTPGMRELQLWAGEEVLDTTFSEISELAAECKFSDCAHEGEPGCADPPGARGRDALAGALGQLPQAPARAPGARDPQGRAASRRGAKGACAFRP